MRAQEAAAGRPLAELRADGGASVNGWLMQFQADVLGVPVVVPEVAETTALGAAYLAGVGAGLLSQDRVVVVVARRARATSRRCRPTSASTCSRAGVRRVHTARNHGHAEGVGQDEG